MWKPEAGSRANTSKITGKATDESVGLHRYRQQPYCYAKYGHQGEDQQEGCPRGEMPGFAFLDGVFHGGRLTVGGVARQGLHRGGWLFCGLWERVLRDIRIVGRYYVGPISVGFKSVFSRGAEGGFWHEVPFEMMGH
ncbi:MAG: hypothetical protein WAN89_07235 [Lawsonella sp.]